MTVIDRLRCNVTTARGGEGSFSFYSVPGGGHQADVVAFLTSIKDVWAAGTVVEVPNTGEQLNDANGDVTGTWSFGSPATLTSASTGAYAAGVGCRIRWSTNGVRNNRHIIGTTFIVPIAVSAYATNGTLDDTFAGTLFSLADDFLDDMAGDLLVWSRPSGPGEDDGFTNTVLSCSVPDKVAWLTSRKE